MRRMVRQFSFVTPILIASMAMPAWGVTPQARPTKSPVATAADLALTARGLLPGQVVDAQGKPMPGAEVRLIDAQGNAVVARTNNRGQFAYQDVPRGVYHLQAGEHVRVTRVWPRTVAPPSAQQSVLLVGESQAIRGQYCPPSKMDTFVRHSKRVLTNPLAVAGIVATAVAIPVAVHNSDDGS